MKTKLLSFICFVAFINLKGQNILYENSFPNGNYLRGVAETDDKGVIAVGWKGTDDPIDGYILKLNSDGTKDFEVILNTGLLLNHHYLEDIEPIQGGNFIVAGSVMGQTSTGICCHFNGLLVKIRQNSSIIWAKKYGTISENSGFNKVIQSIGSGYIAAGGSYCVKIDSLGSLVKKDQQIIIDQLDFLIATCTKPKNKNQRYPKSSEIAKSVKGDMTRCYFKNNILHCISTVQDIEIIKSAV